MQVQHQWFPRQSPKLPFAIVQWLLVIVYGHIDRQIGESGRSVAIVHVGNGR